MTVPIGKSLQRCRIQRGDVGGEGVRHDGEQGGPVAQLGEDLTLSLPRSKPRISGFAARILYRTGHEKEDKT